MNDRAKVDSIAAFLAEIDGDPVRTIMMLSQLSREDLREAHKASLRLLHHIENEQHRQYSKERDITP